MSADSHTGVNKQRKDTQKLAGEGINYHRLETSLTFETYRWTGGETERKPSALSPRLSCLLWITNSRHIPDNDSVERWRDPKLATGIYSLLRDSVPVLFIPLVAENANKGRRC